MERDRIRFGVLGCGGIAAWAHLPALRRLPGVELVVAADPEGDARRRAARIGGVPVLERPDELLSRRDLDAVVICAPTHLHAALAGAACDVGKHVYLEKPLATSRDEADRVVEAAERARVAVAIGFNRRRHPTFERARQLLAEGAIGPVLAVQSRFCEPVPPGGLPEWKRHRASGGGVLLDLASHHVDQVRWLLGIEVVAAEARLASEVSEHDTAWVRWSLAAGVEMQSFFSFRAGTADFIELVGQRGTLRIDRHRSMPSLRVARRRGYGMRYRWLAPTPSELAGGLARLVRPAYEPSYRRSLAAFVDLVRGGPRRLASVEDGIRSLDAVLAAEASAAVGGSVSLAARS